MRYRSLGSTGMQVSTYCLGTMMFGKNGNEDRADCKRMVDLAIDAGVNFVDTADIYSRGESEEIVGETLLGRRDSIILATKVNGPMSDDPNERGNSRRWIIKEVENSLRRLQTDWIDLYQIHRPDPSTNIEDTLSALTDLVHQGKIRAFGCSTFPPEQIVEAHWVAERFGLERFQTEQPPYSIFNRAIERSVLPTTQKYGMGSIVWSPLASGWLAGKYTDPSTIDMSQGRASRWSTYFDPAIPANVRKFDLVAQLKVLAEQAGISLTHLAIAFTVAHPGVTSSIIGPRTVAQIEDLLKGVDVELSDTVLDEIDRIVPPGTNVNEEETGWVMPHLSDPAAYRRPLASRAAA